MLPTGESKQEPSYSPPYNRQDFDAKSAVPPSPYGARNCEKIPLTEAETPQPNDEAATEMQDSEPKSIAIVMALLMGGVVFFLFGGILWLFSNNGYLVLRWSSSYWYLYLGFGTVMLYAGFKFLGSIDRDES
jgi:hypothetical protein